jgi:hypothetical protein
MNIENVTNGGSAMSFVKFFFNLGAIALVFLPTHSLFASVFEELSDNDQYKLKAGEQVAIFTYEQSRYAAWPQGTVYQRIDATPEQAAAVFFDFNHHSEYLPHVLKSDSSFVDRGISRVDYTVGLPYLPFGLGQENYSLDYHLEYNARDKGYSMSWHLSRSGSFTEYSQGSIRFEPMESGGTLVAYDSFVLPYAAYYLAASNSLVIEVSKSILRSVTNSIANQIKKERNLESGRLDQQIKVLKKALGQ